MAAIGISLSFFLFCTFVVHTSALHLTTAPCSGVTEEGEVNFLDIEQCEAEPCNLVRGNTYDFSASFLTGPEPAEIGSITTGLFGILIGVPVTFPGFNETDACRDSNLECPLSANQENLYKLKIFVDPEQTIPISIVVKFELRDNTSGRNLICRKFQVQVV